MLALQHLIAMFGATVLVPMLTGLHPSIALFTAGCGTLIFHICTKGKVPVFLGSSFAFIPVILKVKELYNGDLAYAQGGMFVAGLIYVLVSFLVKKNRSRENRKISCTTSSWTNDNSNRFKSYTNCIWNGKGKLGCGRNNIKYSTID